MPVICGAFIQSVKPDAVAGAWDVTWGAWATDGEYTEGHGSFPEGHTLIPFAGVSQDWPFNRKLFNKLIIESIQAWVQSKHSWVITVEAISVSGLFMEI